MVSLKDLLLARTRSLEDERARQRVLRIRMPFGRKREEEKIELTQDSDFLDGIPEAVPQEKHQANSRYRNS